VTTVRQAIEAHLGSRHVTRVIYGSIIGLALVVVIENHPPAAGVALASVLGTAVAVGLAELYSELVGAELRTGRRIDRAAVVRELDDVAAVAFGVAFPAVFFFLAAIGVMKVDTAIDVSKWSGLGLIAFYGFCGARLTGLGNRRAVVEALAVGAIAAALIGLKAIVH
jgi:VIT1/CCC1 family predicted Fe2+/Mn2+ transporter